MLSTAEILAMEATQAESFNDKVTILNRTASTASTDSYGDTSYSEVAQSGVDCGFNFTNGVRYDKGQVLRVDYDADLRLASTVVIGINDKVVLTELSGKAHSEEFEVFGYPIFGVSAKHITLRRRSN